jgi:Cu/Ag efflux protein CusF
MLKPVAIVLAAIAISACAENTSEIENDNAAALKEATKAAMVIQTYEVEANKVTPSANSGGAGGAER